ncbi:methyltransferase domain-containing protein [Cohnella lupini]|uniref:Methyltransferase family protein n=1 Tax=Cohnella lupini TaxID=1294267 RepID=A0A3D9I7I3_9BACL|nr:methyltransferase domain-containing protein [Cohnella lupini]RED57640.1 methyltransferase family protein [Cohnella lupini]
MRNNVNIVSRTQIAIVCMGFKKDKDIEAVKKEARSYYIRYKKTRPEMDIKFISLEEELSDNEEIYDEEYDVYYWSHRFSERISDKVNMIFHFFADSIDGYYILEKSYEPRSVITLYTVTGINGLREYDEQYLKHVRHAIDVGNLFLFVESKWVQEQFSAAGIYSKVMLPRVAILRKPVSDVSSTKFTVGFASAPLTREVWEDRGIYILLSLIKRLPDISFKIAWRNNGYSELLAILEKEGITNCEVLNGHLDMSEYYKDINVMVAPFASRANNHSCPLSIVEAIVLGIPVLVTEYVGIQDLVLEHGLGLVASDVDDMTVKMKEIRDNYHKYRENALNKGLSLFGTVNNDQITYLQIYGMISNQIPSPTLERWSLDLQDRGKFLVMSREGMAAYYNDAFVADNYDDNRFTDYPMRTYDRLERKAISLLIEQNLNKNKIIESLDIASGDGRILREIVNFGRVTAVENSRFMISVSTKKLQDPSKVTFIETDFFEFSTEERYDIITAFRFIRHFDYHDRRILYRKLYSLVKDDGIIVVDFPDKRAETQLRAHMGWGSFHVYDVFWNNYEIIDELNQNGFKILGQIPVGEYLMTPGTMVNDYLPLSRVVCFSKK